MLPDRRGPEPSLRHFDKERTVGRNGPAGPVDVAVGGVGNPGFNAVAVIELALGNRSRNMDCELALRIQLAFLLANLIAAIVGIVVVAGTDGFVVGIVQQRRPEPAAIKVVFHLGSGHGLAEVILRVNGRLNRFAFEHASGAWGYVNLVLGFLVLLYFEIAAHPAFAVSHLEKVVAERGVCRQRQVVANRAVGRNQRLQRQRASVPGRRLPAKPSWSR